LGLFFARLYPSALSPAPNGNQQAAQSADEYTQPHPTESAMSEQRAPFPRSADNADQMNLPEGKTCGDCVHCKRCTAMFGHIPADQSCDWSPSRFREAVIATA
jgi:hypothetical protein